MYKVTKSFEFEAAHILPAHAGDCKNLHGHSYKLAVTVENDQLDSNHMVLDFSILKEAVEEIINRYDHATILGSSKIENLLRCVLLNNNMKFVAIEQKSTVEAMCNNFFNEIKTALKEAQVNFNYLSVKLWETAASYAEYSAEVV